LLEPRATALARRRTIALLRLSAHAVMLQSDRPEAPTFAVRAVGGEAEVIRNVVDVTAMFALIA
jgi:hypothetical protein